MNNPFKHNYGVDERCMQTKVVLDKHYPQKVPVVIQKLQREQKLNHMARQKFLIPMDMNYGQLLYIIRHRLNISSESGIALFMTTESGLMLTTRDLISEIYDKHKDETDNFLYLFYCSENTFG